jgi:hypothetical protein
MSDVLKPEKHAWLFSSKRWLRKSISSMGLMKQENFSKGFHSSKM